MQPRPKPAAGASSFRTTDDATLLARTAARELRAFEELYRIYYPRLARFVLNLTRRKTLVEEVINDTMVVVWTKANHFAGRSQVSTWIFSIAYRKGLKAMRKWDEPLPEPAGESQASLEPGPEQQLGAGQARAGLISAMRELSDDHRAVLDLAYFHEFGYREIAEIMECPVDTVKTRMFYARRHLRAKLAGGAGDWL